MGKACHCTDYAREYCPALHSDVIENAPLLTGTLRGGHKVKRGRGKIK